MLTNKSKHKLSHLKGIKSHLGICQYQISLTVFKFIVCSKRNFTEEDRSIKIISLLTPTESFRTKSRLQVVWILGELSLVNRCCKFSFSKKSLAYLSRHGSWCQCLCFEKLIVEQNRISEGKLWLMATFPTIFNGGEKNPGGQKQGHCCF